MRSNRKKMALAGVIAALTMGGGSAQAFDANYAVTPTNFASNVLGSATATIANSQAFDVEAELGDLILGRTQGFGIRMTLADGTFSAAPAGAAVGAALTSGNNWTIDPISNPTGSNRLSVTFSPNVTPTGISVGNIVRFAAGDLSVQGIDDSLEDGGTVDVTVDLYDPGTAAVLLTTTGTLFTSSEGVEISFANSQNTNKEIDVGSDVNASKTDFSPDGTINNATPESFYHVGTVSVGRADSVAGGAVQPFSVAGTTFAAYDSSGVGTGTFQFDTTADRVTIALSAEDLAPFRQAGGSIWVEDARAGAATACSAAGGTVRAAVNGGVAAGTGITETSSATGATLTFLKPTTAEDSFDVCLKVPGGNTATIEDQVLSVNASVNLDPTNANAGGLVDPASENTDANMLDLVFNGDSVDLHLVNPGTNENQLSFIRISATGTTGGKVTISGVDDDGVTSSEVSFNLGPNESVQLTATDLESGNASKGLTGSLGDGAGKWRLTITAEYDGLVVTNAIRTPDGFLTNMTKSTAN
jgi:hypothetical protein